MGRWEGVGEVVLAPSDRVGLQSHIAETVTHLLTRFACGCCPHYQGKVPQDYYDYTGPVPDEAVEAIEAEMLDQVYEMSEVRHSVVVMGHILWCTTTVPGDDPGSSSRLILLAEADFSIWWFLPPYLGG